MLNGYIQFYRLMTDVHPLKMTKFPGWDDTVATVSECDGTGAKVMFKVGTQFEKGQELILLKPKVLKSNHVLYSLLPM